MKIFIATLIALFVAGPAFADRAPLQRICTNHEAMAQADDDVPVFVAPFGGAVIKRVGCATLLDVATPATVQYQIGLTDVTHALLTCGENGVPAVWVAATALNTMVEGDLLSFDTDTGTTGDYVVCAEVQTRP